MSDCPVSSQFGTGMNKNSEAGTSPVPEKGTQSGTGMLLYRIEMQDAGMPTPAASTSMPMPSFVNYNTITGTYYGFVPVCTVFASRRLKDFH
jgi:hypothetical protein